MLEDHLHVDGLSPSADGSMSEKKRRASRGFPGLSVAVVLCRVCFLADISAVIFGPHLASFCWRVFQKVCQEEHSLDT